MAIMENVIDLLDKKEYAKVHDILLDMNAVDIAEFLEDIPDDHMLYLFRLLPKDISAEAFSNIEPEMQEIIVRSITDKEITELLDLLFIDDTVDLIEELPSNIVKKILSNTNPYKRRIKSF